MKTLYKKLTSREAPDNISPIWLRKQTDWYRQGDATDGGVPRSARQLMVQRSCKVERCPVGMLGSCGKKFEKDIRQLLALDIKKKAPYQSGTKLVREYEGKKKYEVLILDEGSHSSHPNGCFIFEGMQYKSLSKIAEEITGTRWNGNLFFNVRRT